MPIQQGVHRAAAIRSQVPFRRRHRMSPDSRYTDVNCTEVHVKSVHAQSLEFALMYHIEIALCATWSRPGPTAAMDLPALEGLAMAMMAG